MVSIVVVVMTVIVISMHDVQTSGKCMLFHLTLMMMMLNGKDQSDHSHPKSTWRSENPAWLDLFPSLPLLLTTFKRACFCCCHCYCCYNIVLVIVSVGCCCCYQHRRRGAYRVFHRETLCNISDVQMEFCQIAFQPPPKQTDALWELFSPKIGNFFKTAVLTLEIDILTMTMVKLCS